MLLNCKKKDIHTSAIFSNFKFLKTNQSFTMKTKFLAFAICLFTLASCNQKVTPPQTVTVDDLYTLEVPGTLAPMEDLYPEADLQYGNTFKQVFLVTAHEAKDKTASFEEFTAKALANYNKRPNYEIIKQEDVRINSIAGKMYELKMSQGNDIMFMIQVILDGKKANYQFIGWTPANNQTVETEKFINTLSTFKEQ